MTDDNQHIYVSIRLDEKTGIAKGFMTSEDASDINNYTGKQPVSEETTPDEIKKESPLKTNASDFVKKFDEMRNAIIFLTNMTPSLLLLQNEVIIHQFVKKVGTIYSETSELKKYKISIAYADDLYKKVEDLVNLSKGLTPIKNLHLINLTTAFDTFIARIVREIILSKPSIANQKEKTFSLEELMSIGTIEAAKEQLINKNIDRVMRDNHKEQIKWIVESIELKNYKYDDLFSKLIEIFERRNILIHNNCIVTDQYIAACKNAGYECKNSVGDQLEVDIRYIKSSIDTLLEFGVKLNQVVSRKLDSANIDDSMGELNTTAYNLISRKRYKLAARLLDFGLNVLPRNGSDATRKMMTINHANAEKLSGNIEKSEKIIESVDWSASSLEYSICISAIKSDTESVIRMLPKAAQQGVIDASHIRQWPVFIELRKDPSFITEFERIFAQPLFPKAKNEEAPPLLA